MTKWPVVCICALSFAYIHLQEGLGTWPLHMVWKGMEHYLHNTHLLKFHFAHFGTIF